MNVTLFRTFFLLSCYVRFAFENLLNPEFSIELLIVISWLNFESFFWGLISRLEVLSFSQVSLGIGFLFLGGGMRTFSTNDSSIAALLITLYPRLPTGPNDNRCHLQVNLCVVISKHTCGLTNYLRACIHVFSWKLDSTYELLHSYFIMLPDSFKILKTSPINE